MQVEKVHSLPNDYPKLIERFYGVSAAVSHYIDDSVKGFEKILAGHLKPTFFLAHDKAKASGSLHHIA